MAWGFKNFLCLFAQFMAKNAAKLTRNLMKIHIFIVNVVAKFHKFTDNLDLAAILKYIWIKNFLEKISILWTLHPPMAANGRQ